jgi:hypothetical protein
MKIIGGNYNCSDFIKNKLCFASYDIKRFCVLDDCVFGRVWAYRRHDSAMTSIFDSDYLEIAFRERAHADFVSNLPRDITPWGYTQMDRMLACWIRLCKFQLAM